MERTYRWTEYFTRQRLSCKCELINRSRNTVTIRLKGYGPKGRPPGTVMNVKHESVGLRKEKPIQTELDWHDWTD